VQKELAKLSETISRLIYHASTKSNNSEGDLKRNKTGKESE